MNKLWTNGNKRNLKASRDLIESKRQFTHDVVLNADDESLFGTKCGKVLEIGRCGKQWWGKGIFWVKITTSFRHQRARRFLQIQVHPKAPTYQFRVLAYSIETLDQKMNRFRHKVK